MKIFQLRFLSQYDKAHNLLTIMQKYYKKPYEKPFINHGQNVDEMVRNAINETSEVTNVNGKCKFSVDVKRVSQAIYIRTMFKNILNKGIK